MYGDGPDSPVLAEHRKLIVPHYYDISIKTEGLD